jgi:hypothetical protein
VPARAVMLAGTKKSDGFIGGAGDVVWKLGFGEVERGLFSSYASAVENIVSPGAAGGSSNGAGMRWSAPKPRVHPIAPWPPHERVGVMSTGRVRLYS